MNPGFRRDDNRRESPGHRFRSLFRRLLAATLLLAASLLKATPAEAQLLPPDAPWSTFQTAHFDVTYLPDLEPVARRAALDAESAYELLSREFLPPPANRIVLIITDNLDAANGFAGAFPRNRIVAFAQPPSNEPSLAESNDWLRLLILHELVHIFHFDHSRGVWAAARKVFGRESSIFSQLYVPGWIVEGLAVYYETRLTPAGRASGSTFDMMLRTAVLGDAFPTVDRVSMDPARWPGGTHRYLFGGMFFDHLSRRYGPAAISEFVDRIASEVIPYRPNAASRKTFGSSLTREWTAWRDSLSRHYRSVADSVTATGLTVPEILSTEGWYALYPRYSPDGSRISYGNSTGRDDSGHRVILAGGERVEDRRRSVVGPGGWIRQTGEMLYANQDFVGPYRLYSDLYAEGPAGTRRITRNARVWEPDPAPDGTRAVAVQRAPGTNVLALVDLETSALRPLAEPSSEVYWATPRWSPAGDRIAVGRWTSGGRMDVVIVGLDGAVIQEVATGPSTDGDPAWSPDGRYVVFASDRSGISNVYARDLATGQLHQVTNVLTGAFQPDVSPDGRWIAFSLYAPDGYHIARIPFDQATWRDPPPASAPSSSEASVSSDGASGEPTSSGATRPYSGLRYLLPTYWSLIGGGDEPSLGAATSGRDPVERHLWGAEAVVYPDDWRLQTDAAYRYRGWGNPTLDIAAGDRWSLASQTDTIPDLLRRDTDASLALSWSIRRWDQAASIQTGFDVADAHFRPRGAAIAERDVPVDLGASLGIGYSTVRAFSLSLGPQEGISTSTRFQLRRYVDPPDWAPDSQDYWRITTRNRAFHAFDWFGFAPPTAALKLDGGVESTPVGSGFSLGGTGGSGDGSGLLPDLVTRAVAYPVRGYPVGVQRGSRIVTMSTDYRFPIHLLERGFRVLPLAVDRLWGDLFVDAGTAWCPAGCRNLFGIVRRSPTPLYSVGGEAILRLRVGFSDDFTIRFGAALPLRDPGGGRPLGYVRLGSGL